MTRRPAAPIERASAADLALLAMETGGAVPEHLGTVFVLDAGRGFGAAGSLDMRAQGFVEPEVGRDFMKGVPQSSIHLPLIAGRRVSARK